MHFGIPVITRSDPDMVARFVGAVGNSQVLAFNDRQDPFRIGPEFALVAFPHPGYVKGALSRLTVLFKL